MNIHLIDGTYELFRHYYAVPKAQSQNGAEIGAVKGVLASMLSLLESGASHIAIATDHVIESFRNELYDGYKTGDGIEPELFAQFHKLESGLQLMGFVVWPMIEFEADDALASAAVKYSSMDGVGQVIICSPDKDLSQCVKGDKIVQLDRMRKVTRNENGVVEKFGIRPESIPDYLALVGDSADGIPGIQGWGAKSASSILSTYLHLEEIPLDPEKWQVTIRGAAKLTCSLKDSIADALLYRKLATLRTDAPINESPLDLEWREPQKEAFDMFCREIGAERLFEKTVRQAKMLAAGT